MPLVESTYVAPWVFKNPHLHTIYPYLFRKVKGVKYVRQRLELGDGDFIDLDWSKVEGSDLVLLAHGLEGSAKQAYILGMAKLLNQKGFDIVALNFRSCSGEINRLPRFYHMGETEDLRSIVNWIEKNTSYKSLSLIGHSLGANIILKYLGEQSDNKSSLLSKAITFSCPVDLKASSDKLCNGENVFYMMNFLHTMKNKLKLKIKLGIINESDIDYQRGMNAYDFTAWDDSVTAPLHGFSNHQDYCQKASCYKYLNKIKIPCLLVNSLDDPFLSTGCYPREIAQSNSFFYLEAPLNGGHVGFIPSLDAQAAMTINAENEIYWSERRALEFLRADPI